MEAVYPSGRRSGSIDLDCASCARPRPLPRCSRPWPTTSSPRDPTPSPCPRPRPARRSTTCPARAPTTCATPSPGPGWRSSPGPAPGSPSAGACCCAPTTCCSSRGELLLDLAQLESGKTRGQALEELFQAASVTRYNALSAKRVLRGRRRRAGVPLASTTRVRYRAKGVVGVITPVELRAEPRRDGRRSRPRGRLRGRAEGRRPGRAHDPRAAPRVHRRRACPRRSGPSSPDRRQRSARRSPMQVDYICFTGSTATGRRIAEKAGRRLVGASLELGGKNAMIVLDDVDPEQAAADAAYACFSAMGQLCVSIERIYVQRAVAAPFTAALVERLRSADARVLARLRQRLRIARELRPARARRGPPRRRRREGRRRCSPAAAPAPRSAPGSSSPPCSPASRRRCAPTPRRRSAPSRRSTSSTARRRPSSPRTRASTG